MAKKQELDLVNTPDVKYANGMRSESYEGSTENVSTVLDQLEQRAKILERVRILPAGTKEMKSYVPPKKERQW
jgi:hypothetical protein